MPNRRIAQARGRETILECRITAYPHAVNYWEKHVQPHHQHHHHQSGYWEKDGRRVTSSARHRIEAYDEGAHTVTFPPDSFSPSNWKRIIFLTFRAVNDHVGFRKFLPRNFRQRTHTV